MGCDAPTMHMQQCNGNARPHLQAIIPLRLLKPLRLLLRLHQCGSLLLLQVVLPLPLRLLLCTLWLAPWVIQLRHLLGGQATHVRLLRRQALHLAAAACLTRRSCRRCCGGAHGCRAGCGAGAGVLPGVLHWLGGRHLPLLL